MPNRFRFGIGEVAALLDMTPGSIRAWERRHGAVVPERSAGGTRRYSLADVERLRRIKSLAATRSVRISVLQADGMALSTAEDGPSTGPSEPGLDGPEWRAAADLSADLQMFLSPEGGILDANIAVARALGVVRGRLVGTRFAELAEPHDRAKAVRLYRGQPVRRTGWELNLKTRPPALYRFDSWPLKAGARAVLFVRGTNISTLGMPWLQRES
jgi:PAS domain-containing protein